MNKRTVVVVVIIVLVRKLCIHFLKSYDSRSKEVEPIPTVANRAGSIELNKEYITVYVHRQHDGYWEAYTNLIPYTVEAYAALSCDYMPVGQESFIKKEERMQDDVDPASVLGANG